MSSAAIDDAILTRVETLQSSALPIAYPGKTFDPATEATAGKYLIATILPNRPAWEGLADDRLDQGLLQIDVVWPKNTDGAGDAIDAVLTAFAKSTVMHGSGVRVKISTAPWRSAPIDEPDRTRTPITIPWVASAI